MKTKQVVYCIFLYNGENQQAMSELCPWSRLGSEAPLRQSVISHPLKNHTEGSLSSSPAPLHLWEARLFGINNPSLTLASQEEPSTASIDFNTFTFAALHREH